jgi:hypothetical protein
MADIMTLPEIPEANTQLSILPVGAISTIFAADDTGILADIAAKVAAHKEDVTNKKARDATRSLAADVASSKVALIKLGKKLTEGYRAKTAAVNAECNIIEDRMNELRDQVRAPLTEYENREKRRVDTHEQAIADIAENPEFYMFACSDDLKVRLAFLAAYPAREWEEFAAKASNMLTSEITKATDALSASTKREAEAIELERLRAEAVDRRLQDEARARVERDRQLQAEAATKARMEAEAEAHRILAAEKHRAAVAEKEAQHKTEQAIAAQQAKIGRMENERRAAEERAAQAERDRTEAAESAKREAEQTAIKVNAERLAAEQRAAMAQALAVEAERQKYAAKAAAEQHRIDDAKHADDERAAKRENQSKVMTAVKEALMKHAEIDEVIAVRVVKAIVAKQISHTSVQF